MQTDTMSLDFKIGMVAPSKAGKTSLLSAIFQEMNTRLSGNAKGIQYFAADSATRNAITRAVAAFKTCTASDDVFEVPAIEGSQDTHIYKFAFTVPVGARTGTQRLNIDVLDYPGGLLGTPDFENKVRPHLEASTALLIPIPADVLMKWYKTKGRNTDKAKRENMASQCILEVETVVGMVKDWAKRRAAKNEASLLMLVPVRCEAYFNDNGGRTNESGDLHKAVKELYVEPLQFSAEERTRVQIETHAVDTYGIVELRDIDLVKNKTGETLNSTFMRRRNCGNDIAVKGAFEVLATVVRFRLGRYAKQLGVARAQLERAIKNRSFIGNIWAWLLFGDSKKKALLKNIQHSSDAFQAMTVVSDLFRVYPDRQKVINTLSV